MARCQFQRHIGIDYSGAGLPGSSLKGLRAYVADGVAPPVEALPPAGGNKYWSRQGLATWLLELLGDGVPTLVGLDHGFSFPEAYFSAHDLPRDWDIFLADFQRHWPTHEPDISVEMIRLGQHGHGAARSGNSRWRRVCEQRCRAKSVFHFDVPGSVAKSTHAGLPWLGLLRRELGEQLHFWPFDGWQAPRGRSLIAEAYPSLWNKEFPRRGRIADQHDAYVVAAALRRADHDGSLPRLLQPNLEPPVAELAQFEGWILGVE